MIDVEYEDKKAAENHLKQPIKAPDNTLIEHSQIKKWVENNVMKSQPHFLGLTTIEKINSGESQAKDGDTIANLNYGYIKRFNLWYDCHSVFMSYNKRWNIISFEDNEVVWFVNGKQLPFGIVFQKHIAMDKEYSDLLTA